MLLLINAVEDIGHGEGSHAMLACSAMKDKMTNKPRGFGFVQYEDPDSVEAVMQEHAG